jgi:hypothetical protein
MRTFEQDLRRCRALARLGAASLRSSRVAEGEALARGAVLLDGTVFVSCARGCGNGAIYVPEVGPMGDEFHETVAEAEASGRRWSFDEDVGGFVCPLCEAIPMPAPFATEDLSGGFGIGC